MQVRGLGCGVAVGGQRITVVRSQAMGCLLGPASPPTLTASASSSALPAPRLVLYALLYRFVLYALLIYLLQRVTSPSHTKVAARARAAPSALPGMRAPGVWNAALLCNCARWHICLSFHPTAVRLHHSVCLCLSLSICLSLYPCVCVFVCVCVRVYVFGRCW